MSDVPGPPDPPFPLGVPTPPRFATRAQAQEPTKATWHPTAVSEACMAVVMEVTDALGTATLARTMQLNPPLARLIEAVRAEERAASANALEADQVEAAGLAGTLLRLQQEFITERVAASAREARFRDALKAVRSCNGVGADGSMGCVHCHRVASEALEEV